MCSTIDQLPAHSSKTKGSNMRNQTDFMQQLQISTSTCYTVLLGACALYDVIMCRNPFGLWKKHLRTANYAGFELKAGPAELASGDMEPFLLYTR